MKIYLTPLPTNCMFPLVISHTETGTSFIKSCDMSCRQFNSKETEFRNQDFCLGMNENILSVKTVKNSKLTMKSNIKFHEQALINPR
jgi:hypothetical protein